MLERHAVIGSLDIVDLGILGSFESADVGAVFDGVADLVVPCVARVAAPVAVDLVKSLPFSVHDDLPIDVVASSVDSASAPFQSRVCLILQDAHLLGCGETQKEEKSQKRPMHGTVADELARGNEGTFEAMTVTL